MNAVRCSINVTIKLVAIIGLPLECVLYVLKITGCVGRIGIGFEQILPDGI